MTTRYDSANLPERIKLLLPKDDPIRKTKAGRTLDEVIEDNQVKSERNLHDQISAYLRIKDIWFCHSRMDKRTTTAVGTPDYLMSVRSVPIALEAKVGYNKLSDEQIAVQKAMEKDGWRYFVVRNLEAVKIVLTEFGA